jgi:hypothetical protein
MIYNDFMSERMYSELKGRREIIGDIKDNNLGLITDDESFLSLSTAHDAQNFIQSIQ